MKIAAFFSDSPYASWTQSRGFAAVLRRMGHDVVDIAVPQGYKQMRQIKRALVEKVNKSIDGCDLILVSGPEHLQDWINQFYPAWAATKIPKVGWYHESFEAREDYKINFEAFRAAYDFHIFPDADDAAKFGGEFLSLGVDTEMFNPFPDEAAHRRSRIPTEQEMESAKRYHGDHWFRRDIDSAFIGLMYPKRVRFFQELQPHLKGLDLRIANGNILVQDLDGINIERSMELLAEQYRRIKVFVAFPSLCNVLVAKPLEAGACGCLVMVEKTHGLKRVAQYKSPAGMAELMHYWLDNPKGREQMAREFCEEVHREHRMELRFEKIFSLVGANVAA